MRSHEATAAQVPVTRKLRHGITMFVGQSHSGSMLQRTATGASVRRVYYGAVGLYTYGNLI
jgi:hypothetical protein